MKYMLLIFNTPRSLAKAGADLDELMGDVDTLMTELRDSGEWIGGEALAPPQEAKTVTVRDGAPVVTDGPFAEAKEHLAGYCLLECETEERALEIAGRWPGNWLNGVELRPLRTPEA